MRRRDKISAYAVVLADLKGQRDDLDRMIRLIEARIAEPAGSESKADGEGKPAKEAEPPILLAAAKAASA